VNPKVCDLLLIEDDENDVFFFQRGLRALGFPGGLLVTDSPAQAWHFLKAHAENNPPALIITHSFYREDGLKDLTQWIRAHPTFARTPVVVYTGMMDAESYFRGQGGEVFPVVQKTGDIKQLPHAIRSILLHLPAHCREWLA
jgi:hypothetical protein